MSSDTAICAACGSRVPMDLLAAHLSEHHEMSTEQIEREMAEAEVIDLTETDE